MTGPLNPTDFCRFLRLAALIEQTSDSSTEISIYTSPRSDGYFVSLELQSSGVDSKKVLEIFQSLSSIEERKVVQQLLGTMEVKNG